MEKNKATEKLFKAIYGALIDKDNQELGGQEIVEIAIGTVWHFAKNEGLIIKGKICKDTFI